MKSCSADAFFTESQKLVLFLVPLATFHGPMLMSIRIFDSSDLWDLGA